MKILLTMCIFTFIFYMNIFCSKIFAHGGGEASIEIGKDKGVMEVLNDGSFILSSESIKRLKITGMPVKSFPVQVSRSAISYSLLNYNLFKMNGSTFKKINFNFISKSKNDSMIQSVDLKNGDQVVITGVGYLQIISSQLGENKEEEKGGAHHD